MQREDRGGLLQKLNKELVDEKATAFFMQLGEALLPYVAPLKSVFKYYAGTGLTLGAAASGAQEATLSPMQFGQCVRGMGLCKEDATGAKKGGAAHSQQT